jgi:uncharacterized repeat protein (TIGR03803 family)
MPTTLQQRVSKLGVGVSITALVVVLGFWGSATSLVWAQTFTVLHNFTGSSDGGDPYGGLIQDASGTLFGATMEGGDPTCDPYHGCGVVFKMDTSGKETVLFAFPGYNHGNGYDPMGGLLLDKAGNLYGTTEGGGGLELGALFKVDASGTESIVYSFTGGRKDGANPYSTLIQDKSGNLYGTTSMTGSISCAQGCGTVFKFNPQTGKETALHRFNGSPSDGAWPLYGSLLMDKEGNLYGSTLNGGSVGCAKYGGGVVYKLTPSGRETVLHVFTGGDGCGGSGSLAMDTEGNLFGTTIMGGKYNNGTVWKLNLNSHKETVLHSFTTAEGFYPWGGVTMDAKGNLYGDIQYGGANGDGMVWRLSKSGKLTVLHSFTESDGRFPFGSVYLDAKGVLYGMTRDGGAHGNGVVFKLTP